MAALIDSLAYVVAQSTDMDKWRHYGEQVLGMQFVQGGLKMDERDFRIALVAGEQDRYFASGWTVADQAALDKVVKALKGAGVEVE